MWEFGCGEKCKVVVIVNGDSSDTRGVRDL